MKKTQPSFNNNWQAQNHLSVQQAVMIAGGDIKVKLVTSQPNLSVYASTSESSATLASSTGRPPFN
jgi:hypothetical protein